MHVPAQDHRATPDVPRERRTVAEPLVEMIVAMLDPILAVDDLMRVGADPAIRALDLTLAARVPTLAGADPAIRALDPTLAVDDLMRVGADPAIRALDPTLAARVPSALMWHARYRLKSWSDVEPPSTDGARVGAGSRARAQCT